MQTYILHEKPAQVSARHTGQVEFICYHTSTWLLKNGGIVNSSKQIDSFLIRLMEAFAAKYLRDAGSAVTRAAIEFMGGETLPRIHVGKSRLSVPIDKVQMVLHSGFWRRLTEDGAEVPQILDAFEIPSVYDETFLQAWLIVNGILPVATTTENIYCDYLMVDGYVPPVPSDAKHPIVPQFYCESGKVVCKGIVTTDWILQLAREFPDSLQEVIEENAPAFLSPVKKGLYRCAKDPTDSYHHIIWHESLGDTPPTEADFLDSDRGKSLSFGGGDGTEDVYVGDAWYEPNNEEFIGYHEFSWVMSKNPKYRKTRAIGFFVCNGGDQGKDVHYLMGGGNGDNKNEIVAFYV